MHNRVFEFDRAFISDLHLGNQACKIDKLISFLERANFRELYLVGDIVDLTNFGNPPDSHLYALRLLTDVLPKEGILVKFVWGNHDPYLFENSEICFGSEGILAIHGDQIEEYLALSFLDTLAYKVAKLSGLATLIKQKFGEYIPYLKRFESLALMYAASRGYDVVITGHTHYPKIFRAEDCTFVNCGDWTEHCSYVVQVGSHFKLRYEP